MPLKAQLQKLAYQKLYYCIILICSGTQRRDKPEGCDLGVKEVFSYDVNLKIYVNEFLSSNMHALLTRTRAKAREIEYKYVWVRSGRIAVRRAKC